MSNKELLDWAVENVEEWHNKYTHLRSDNVGTFYTIGGQWFGNNYNRWVPYTHEGYRYGINHGLLTVLHQVITKEEWQEAKQPKPSLPNLLKDNLIVMQEYARRLLAGESVDGLEYYDNSGKWHTATLTPDFITTPLTYRFKPDEVIHKGGVYPKPLTKEEGNKLPVVWVINGAFSCGYVKYTKVNTEFYYKHGLVFSAEEDAKQAAKVMFNMGE